MEISYESLEEEIIKTLGESAIMMLATSADNRVTARSMSCIFNSMKIAFQTGSSSTKMNQIRKNPLVALCLNNIQIEGKAVVLGHPYDIPWFREQYARLYPGSFKTYSWLDEECVVEVEPSLVTVWKYDSDGRPYIERLNVTERKAVREYVPLVGSKRDE